MDGLLSFLLFAGFFFLMMRFGCGAHMAHGHGAGHESKKLPPPDDAGRHVDPVCAKDVPPLEGYGKMHAGALYRFCSRDCLDAFEADPSRYARIREEVTP